MKPDITSVIPSYKSFWVSSVDRARQRRLCLPQPPRKHLHTPGELHVSWHHQLSTTENPGSARPS